MAVLENAWYYLALKAAIPMAAMSGSAGDTAAYRTRMNSIAAEFTSSFWNASGQYFISSSVTSPDDRANAMAVLSGLAQPQHYSGIRTVLTQRTYASPWMEKYVLEALCMIKSEDAALTRMKSRYAAMVNAGYTTLWEVWSGLKDGTINHGWNAPNTVLSQYIAGVAPTAAGWSSYGVLPQMANLTAISGVVPSIKGNITVNDSLSSSQFVMNLTSPQGTKALVGIPKKRAWQSVTANGGTVWNQGAFLAGVSGVSGAGEDSLYIKFNHPDVREKNLVWNEASLLLNVLPGMRGLLPGQRDKPDNPSAKFARGGYTWEPTLSPRFRFGRLAEKEPRSSGNPAR
jgi:alpha-L-rhamnosidase